MSSFVGGSCSTEWHSHEQVNVLKLFGQSEHPLDPKHHEDNPLDDSLDGASTALDFFFAISSP